MILIISFQNSKFSTKQNILYTCRKHYNSKTFLTKSPESHSLQLSFKHTQLKKRPHLYDHSSESGVLQSCRKSKPSSRHISDSRSGDRDGWQLFATRYGPSTCGNVYIAQGTTFYATRARRTDIFIRRSKRANAKRVVL